METVGLKPQTYRLDVAEFLSWIRSPRRRDSKVFIEYRATVMKKVCDDDVWHKVERRKMAYNGAW